MMVTRADTLSEMVDQVLLDETSGHLVIGPLVWQPDRDGKKTWYVMAAGADRDGFRTDMLAFGDDREFAEGCRASIIDRIAIRGPRVIHDACDELGLARLCEAIWPGDKTRKARDG